MAEQEEWLTTQSESVDAKDRLLENEISDFDDDNFESGKLGWRIIFVCTFTTIGGFVFGSVWQMKSNPSIR